MKLGVFYNCQHMSLAVCLRALFPGAEVLAIPMARAAATPQSRAATAADLASCDAVLSGGAPPGWGELADQALQATTRRLTVIPPLWFRGYHPDTIYIDIEGGQLAGPTGGYHSRIAVAAYLAGLTPGQTAGLYNRLAFMRLGYFREFAASCALAAERYDRAGIPLAPHLAAWTARGCFMHSGNHPKLYVVLDIARLACARLGLTPAPDIDEAMLEDDLYRFPTHPLFPALAAPLGLPGDTRFKRMHRHENTPVTLGLEEFLVASFETYATAPSCRLQAADGVAGAQARLNLPPP